MLLHELMQCVRKLGHHFVVAGANLVRYATAHVIFQQGLIKGFYSSTSRCCLYKNISAISVFFKHTLNAA